MSRAERARALDEWAEQVDATDLTEADLASLQAIAALAEQRLAIDDELVDRIRIARRHGRSWSQIGAMLGVSKQAAQRKYGPKV